MQMTALEMAARFKWVALTVSFHYGDRYGGHVTAEGQTRIVTGQGTAVWVDKICLSNDTVVCVHEIIGTEGAKVGVYQRYQTAA